MIIHGKEEIIIPYDLGKKLYEYAIRNRKPEYGKVSFFDCGCKPEYGKVSVFDCGPRDQQRTTNCLSQLLSDALTSFIDNE